MMALINIALLIDAQDGQYSRCIQSETVFPKQTAFADPTRPIDPETGQPDDTFRDRSKG